jgi:hypothetical protein
MFDDGDDATCPAEVFDRHPQTPYEIIYDIEGLAVSLPDCRGSARLRFHLSDVMRPSSVLTHGCFSFLSADRINCHPSMEICDRRAARGVRGTHTHTRSRCATATTGCLRDIPAFPVTRSADRFRAPWMTSTEPATAVCMPANVGGAAANEIEREIAPLSSFDARPSKNLQRAAFADVGDAEGRAHGGEMTCRLPQPAFDIYR